MNGDKNIYIACVDDKYNIVVIPLRPFNTTTLDPGNKRVYIPDIESSYPLHKQIIDHVFEKTTEKLQQLGMTPSTVDLAPIAMELSRQTSKGDTEIGEFNQAVELNRKYDELLRMRENLDGQIHKFEKEELGMRRQE